MLSYCYLKHLRRSLYGITSIQLRFKSKKKDHWANMKKKSTPTDRALEHFDEFYKNIFGTSWPSIRLALLNEPKYCAVVNFFGDNEENVRDLQSMGCIDIRETFQDELQNWQKQNPLTNIKRPMFETVAPTNNLITPDPIEESQLNPAVFNNRVILPSDSVGSSMNETLLHDFVPASQLKSMGDWVEESDQLKYYDTSGEFEIPSLENGPLEFPAHLRVFAFGRGDVTRFPPPKAGVAQTLGFYLMDAGSILPVLALNLQPGDHVLDLCAAPGGKSLVMLQTMLLGRLVCNDTGDSRVKRIHKVFQQYFGSSKAVKDTVRVSSSNGVLWSQKNAFDKVLVDAPCTSDRHSLMEDDNNMFKPTRMRERINLPELQAALLMSAMQAVKPGGTVVYSTCSLSPIQNDGVVHMALKRAAAEFGIVGGIRNLENAFKPLEFIYRFTDPSTIRYGQLALPFLPNNYGPTYICKIERIR